MPFQKYSTLPEYTLHGFKEDVVNVLVSQIKIWTPVDGKWFDVPSVTSDKCTVLTEVESIEISNSYKELISTAVIKIPRGTIISKITKYKEEISTGNHTNQDEETDLNNATVNGQVVTDEVLVNTDGDSVLPIRAYRSEDDDYGAIIVTRRESDRIATDKDFSIGSRVQIKVGYVSDVFDDTGKLVLSAEDRLEQLRTLDDADEYELVFTGFIVGCSASSPLEINCENMASILKKVNCPNIVGKKNYTVNDFLKAGGQFDLLKDTGIELSPVSQEAKIDLGRVSADTNVTVADVIKEWGECGIIAFMEPDGKHLRVGLANNVGVVKDGGVDNKDYIAYSDNNQRFIAQFDWDVASDDLKIIHGDKKYLAVRATGFTADNKKFGLTVRCKAGSIDELEEADDEDVEFSVVNERKPRPKRGHKRKNGTYSKPKQPGTVVETQKENKVKLNKYTVVPFISRKIPTTRAALLEDAKAYWKSYSPNGISGTITMFGDVRVYIADTIGLIDPTRPEINGYYLVESVDIDFGVNGYRKKIKIPNRIQGFSGKVKIIK